MYRICEISIDIKLSLAAGSCLVKLPEQLQCVAEITTCFGLACFVTDYPVHIVVTKSFQFHNEKPTKKHHQIETSAIIHCKQLKRGVCTIPQ